MPIKVEGILMYVRVLSLFAAILLVAACQTTPTTTAVSGGEGSVPATGGEGARGIGGSGGALGDVVSTPIPHVELQQWLSTNIGDRVNFALDKYSISQAAATRLERQSVWLKDNPEIPITIEGNCDERGTREYNLGLGDRRANAVKNYLVALGIDASRINTISHGKESPMILGSNEDAWAQNRNAQTIVY